MSDGACIVNDPMMAGLLAREGLDTVEGAFACGGGEDLSKPGLGHRRRTRLQLTDEAGAQQELYLKRYGPEPLARRVWKLLTSGHVTGEAEAEFGKIHAVRRAVKSTMEPLAWGQEPGLLGPKRSYIIVAAVPGDALERCGEEFFRRHERDTNVLKRFTVKLAQLVQDLHRAGLFHRDLYASHIFLHEQEDDFEMYLIDLARVIQPCWRRERWRIKDLAALKYSMPRRWVEEWWDEFLATCLGDDSGDQMARWDRRIDARVEAMRRRAERKATEKRMRVTNE